MLSRGGTSGSTCIQPVYTRTDAWASFIISTAETAASDGGYTAPPWTQPPPPPPPDGGTEDASTTADGGPPPPPPGTLGAPCGDNSDCDSGICESDNGGQTWICSQHCQASLNGSDCGLPNYQCLGADDSGMGYCFPAPSSNSNSSSGGGGGCAVGHSDPSKPVPWGTLMLGGTFIGVGVIRQKQRKRSKD